MEVTSSLKNGSAAVLATNDSRQQFFWQYFTTCFTNFFTKIIVHSNCSDNTSLWPL